ILRSLPIIVPPTITFSFPYEAKHGISLKDLFADLKSNVTLNSSFVKPPDGQDGQDGQHHSVTSQNKNNLQLETSYRIGTYQASLKTPANWSYTPSVYLDGYPLFNATIVTNMKWTEADGVSVFMTERKRDLEGNHKMATIPCSRSDKKCRILITYSIQITELLPPPYDTKCHNYERYGYSSRENCFSECL